MSILEKYFEKLSTMPTPLSVLQEEADSCKEAGANIHRLFEPDALSTKARDHQETRGQDLTIIAETFRQKFGNTIALKDIDFSTIEKKYGETIASDLFGGIGLSIASAFVELLSRENVGDLNTLMREAADMNEQNHIEDYIVEYLRKKLGVLY